ncbi:DUF6098 family protein [Leucobacter sp. wl10]|uniref:DUF6098 family protein n=1 Tax=Leucobacter sp. wl10 TaxID=2304677 RepID=UPI000E5A71BE|nr:DUF6098 family protein [Leucobacter sp. wl10]RGE21145.1 hypothetical protein D1J51_07205 [Leucobacter sp. wl10]
MGSPFDTSTGDFEVEALTSLYQLEGALRRYPHLHVRYSEGPVADSRARSVDAESGLELPGLPANPLQPEDWWHRPAADWLARQLCRCGRLRKPDPDRFAWVLTGVVVGRGPDGEPLLRDVVPVARLSESLLEEAEERYRTHFDASRGLEA